MIILAYECGGVELRTVAHDRWGDKKGTENTWLVDAVNNGAVILTRCEAERFILVNDDECGKARKRCVGVIVKQENMGKKLEIGARVAVSGGSSLLTPPLLIASGLENSNIGRNLHLHPVSFVWGYFPDSQMEVKGKSYEGGILTSLHQVKDQDSNVQAIVEATSLGPAAFASLFPWVSR
ncbi:hypothetical protein ACS0TY_000631 [Phlomoides rotata]